MNKRSLLVGFAVALACSLILNATQIRFFLDASDALDTYGDSTDERYYFTLIRRVAQGNNAIGHASSLEHRSDPSMSSYAPVVQGLLMRAFDLHIEHVIFIGDLVFPFLTALFLFIALTFLFEGIGWSIVLTICSFSIIAIGLLRSISPQITAPLLIGYAAAFFLPGYVAPVVRGLIVGCIVFAHVITGPFLLACEGFFLLSRYPKWRSMGVDGVLFAIPVFMAVIGKFLLTLDSDPIAILDTYHRQGLISTHIPAAPVLQAKIVVLIFAMIGLRRYRPGSRRETSAILLFCFSLLAVLNQSVIHGKDVVFGLYYTLPATITLVIGIGVFLRHVFLKRAMQLVSMIIFSIISVTVFTQEMLQLRNQDSSQRSSTESSEDVVLQYIASLSGSRVIAAPWPLADRIPPVTGQYVLLNRFTRYQYGTDEELVRRFILQEALFPDARNEHAFNIVFGIGPGNAAAKARVQCRIDRLISSSDSSCDFRQEEYVSHPSDLMRFQNPDKDLLTAIRTFHVDTIVSVSPLPPQITPLCHRDTTIGSFGVFTCSAASDR